MKALGALVVPASLLVVVVAVTGAAVRPFLQTRAAIVAESVYSTAGSVGPKRTNAEDRTIFAVALPVLSTTGTVTLLNYSASPLGRTVTFEIRQPGTANVVETHVVTLDANGSYSFSTTLSGLYDITAKASHWLRQKRTNQTLGGPQLVGVNYQLVNGDIDGNNAVGLGDFAQLRAAFGSVPGDSNWNPEADLDGSGSVGLGDFSILRKNFGRAGDYVLGVPYDIPPSSPFGYLPNPMTFPDWMESVIPTDSSSAPGGTTPTASGGPSSAVSVDMAYGVVNVDSGPDLLLSNPDGPDITFERRYRTALAAGNISSPGLPPGWTHNWDYKIIPSSTTSWSDVQLVYPSGGSETLTPILDGNGNPTGVFSAPQWVHYSAAGVPGPNHTWTSITISENAPVQTVFSLPTGDTVYRLARQVFSNGKSVNLSYVNGALTQIDNANSVSPMQLNLTYSNGLLQTAADAVGGLQRTYGYTSGELTAVSEINTANSEWRFQYTTGSPYFVTSVSTKDSNGNLVSASLTYETTTGRAQQQTDAKGNNRIYSYADNGGGTVSIYNAGETNPFDQSSVTTDADAKVTSATSEAGDDTVSLEYGGIDPSVVTNVQRKLGSAIHMTTDGHGHVTRVDYPYGNHTEVTWDYPSDALQGRVMKVQEFGRSGETQSPTTYQYYPANDPNGNPEGYLGEVDLPCGGFVHYTYTPKGSIATITGPTTSLNFEYTHPPQGGTVDEHIGLPFSVVDALGRKTWFNYDALGRLIWTRDPMLVESSIQYDVYGQPMNISAALNTPLLRTLGFAYSQTSKGKAPISATLTGAGQQMTLIQRAYDGEWATSQVTDANNNPDTLNLDGQFSLSTLLDGNHNQMHKFTPLPSTRQFRTTLGSGPKWLDYKFNYDQNGCPRGTTDASDGLTSVVQPNPVDNLLDLPSSENLTLNSSQRGAGTAFNSYTYDGFGRIAACSSQSTVAPTIHPAQGGGISEPIRSHSYTYDDENHVKRDDTSYGTETVTTSYTYNADGTRRYMFVNLPFVSGHSVPHPYVCYGYGYDAADRLTSVTARFADTDSDDGSGIVAGVLASASYSYDDDDRVIAVRTPKATVLYAYDSLGNLLNLYNLTPDHTGDQYAPPADQFTEDGRWLSQGTTHSVLSAYTMASTDYDAQGNRLNMSILAETKVGNSSTPSSFGSGNAQFTYDNGGRLWTENWSGSFGPIGGNRTLSHSYDSADNLTSLRGFTWSYDSASDQPTGSTTPNHTTLAFDPTGEEQSSDAIKYWFHLQGGLGLAEGTPADILFFSHYFDQAFGYDPSGLRFNEATRVSSTLGGSGDFGSDSQEFRYDGSALVIRWIANWSFYYPSDLGPAGGDFTSDAYVLYLWGPTGPVMEFDTKGHSKAFTFDPQGSIVGTTIDVPASNGHPATAVTTDPVFYDGYGMQVWPYLFPYGTLDGGLDLRSMRQPFQYKGQFGYYTDSHTGLCYCLNRYYDPQSGRWLSRDPIGLGGGVNVYGYCDGNPVMGADPSGLQGPIDPFGQSARWQSPWEEWRRYCGADSPAGALEFWHTMAKNGSGVMAGMLKVAVAGPSHHPDLLWRGLLDIGGEYVSMGLGAAGPAAEAEEGFLVVGRPALTPHLLGLEGELGVRETFDIGARQRIYLANGRYIVPDGITAEAISEVKNVARQAFTKQLRSYLEYAETTNRRMDLYVRSGNATKLSGPLKRLVAAGRIRLIRSIK